MANQFPLILDSDTQKVKELPADDNLDLTGNDIVSVRNIIPEDTELYNLGSPDKRWNDLFLSGNTIDVDGSTISIVNGNFVFKDSAGNDANLSFGGNTTDDLNEGSSNLYFTTQRIDDHLVGGTGINYDGGVISVAQNVDETSNVKFNDLTLTGNLTVEGSQTILETAVLQVEDQNIELGKVDTPSNSTANTGGITVLGGSDGDKTWKWLSATNSWTSSENIDLIQGKEYTIDGSKVLDSSSLGSTVVSSSLTSVGTLDSGSITSGFGNIDIGSNTFTGNGITVPSISKSGSNGVGNIGSSTNSFDTVHAKATSAQYADLAEKYVADAAYVPGTVVAFGGTEEVTVSDADADARIAGVISTNPSYLMNAAAEGEFVAEVALTGRVPTKVTGTVRKGDMMVSNGDGTARAEASPSIGTVIGKALENFDGDEGVIEVVVGRL